MEAAGCWSWHRAAPAPRLREGVVLKGQGPSEGRAEQASSAGTGERLSGEASLPIPSSALLGRTVVDDPQGFFKKHREEVLEERRKLYRLALLRL